MYSLELQSMHLVHERRKVILKLSFRDYYFNYLGLNLEELQNGKSVFSSLQRDKPLNKKFVYKFIATFVDGNLVCSIAPEYFNDFKMFIKNREVEQLDDVTKTSRDFFQSRLHDFNFRKMYRLTINENNIYSSGYDTQVIQLTKGILMKIIDDMSEEDKLKIWEKRKQEVQEGRRFIMLDGKKIAATSIITDIDFLGANIAVYTEPDYRNKGFGKQVVGEAVKWCFKNSYIPIYLVDSQNIASINLAKSLGFEIKSEEIVVSITL